MVIQWRWQCVFRGIVQQEDEDGTRKTEQKSSAWTRRQRRTPRVRVRVRVRACSWLWDRHVAGPAVRLWRSGAGHKRRDHAPTPPEAPPGLRLQLQQSPWAAPTRHLQGRRLIRRQVAERHQIQWRRLLFSLSLSFLQNFNSQLDLGIFLILFSVVNRLLLPCWRSYKPLHFLEESRTCSG